MKLCFLCKVKEATKKNSHIFPRYMGTTMIETPDKKRKAFNTSTRKFSQDTPKENYIFCPKCEAYLGKLEKKFADEFYNVLVGKNHSFQRFYLSRCDKYLIARQVDYFSL